VWVFENWFENWLKNLFENWFENWFEDWLFYIISTPHVRNVLDSKKIRIITVTNQKHFDKK